MCLYITENSRIRKATKDIKCLKIVYEDAIGELSTPFQRCVVELGKTYTSEIKIVRSKWDNTKLINIGLHSLITIKDCNLVIRKIDFSGIMNAKIVECTIPKDSKYIKGRFDGDWDSYVSDTIVYNKIIQH